MNLDSSNLAARAADLADHCRAEVARQTPHLPALLAEQISALSSSARARGATEFPSSLWSRLRQQAAIGPAELSGEARRFLVLELLAARPFLASTIRMPASVMALYPRQLERILRALDAPTSDIDLCSDPWRKNLLILSGGLVPVGAEFADMFAGIPRRNALRGGIRQMIEFATTIVFRTGGFGPCLELHAHPHSLEDFNSNGWIATYHRLAELLALNPEFKAVTASSWFRDPALASISPRLTYLRDFPCQHGARLFVTGQDKEGTSGALARSPTRRRLFEVGSYIPTIHLMVWPRRDLLRWHDSAQPASHAGSSIRPMN